MKSLFSNIWSSLINSHENDSSFEELKYNIYFQKIIFDTLNLNKPELTKFLSIVLKEIALANDKKLKKLITIGIPNELSSLRSLCWKILLGYLPINITYWESILEIKRQDFYKLKYDIIAKLSGTLKNFQFKLMTLNLMENSINESSNSIDIVFENSNFNNQNREHEIILSKLSNIDFFRKILPEHKFRNYPDFKEFFMDYTTIDDINKDISRTRSITMFPSFSQKNNGEDIMKTHSDIIIRILYIYAKENPNVGYVQGMNEIVSKIYHSYMIDNNFIFSMHLEADTYHSFCLFMNRIKDIYSREMDFASNGIKYQLSKIKFMLKLLEKDVFSCFEKNYLEIDLFCFRWYAVIFAQDIESPDIFRLWDFLFIEEDIYDFLNFTCVAVLRIKKSEFIKLDMAGIMDNLKNLKKINIDILIKTAFEIKNEFRMKKIEKQFALMK